MSIPYGGGYAPQPTRTPTGRVNFGWIGESWSLFTSNAGTWIVTTLAALAVPIIGYVIFVAVIMSSMFAHGAVTGRATSPPVIPQGFVAGMYAVMLLYFPYIMAGYLRMATKQVRGEPLNFTDLFSGGPTTLRMIGLSVLVMAVGLLLEFILAAICGVSGFMWSSITMSTAASAPPPLAGFLVWELLVLVFSALLSPLVVPAYVLVADNWSIFDALRSSVSTVAGDWLRGVGLNIVLGFIYVASAIPCGLGIFVTLPMMALVLALVYRDMIGMPGMPQPGSFYTQPEVGAYYSEQPVVWPPPPHPGAANPNPPPNSGQGGWTPPPGA
jgi:hypothetical protein